MKYTDFTMKEHGFVGHMAEPDEGSDRAVIIIMGGEQSLLPGIKFAERFADYGITGLAVSLFGAEGLPDSPNMIPIDMFLPAVKFLRERKQISRISIYGQSMGSIFAVMAAQYIGGFENLIMVSPTHVPFEGTGKDKKTMSGRSVATWKGSDIPFAKEDFSAVKATKYYRVPGVPYKVTGMWIAYKKAYEDEERVRQAMLHPELSGARILLIAGDEDEKALLNEATAAAEELAGRLSALEQLRSVPEYPGEEQARQELTAARSSRDRSAQAAQKAVTGQACFSVCIHAGLKGTATHMKSWTIWTATKQALSLLLYRFPESTHMVI